MTGKTRNKPSKNSRCDRALNFTVISTDINVLQFIYKKIYIDCRSKENKTLFLYVKILKYILKYNIVTR